MEQLESDLQAARRVQARSVKRTIEALDAAASIARAADAAAPAAESHASQAAALRTILSAVQDEHRQLHARLSKLSKSVTAFDERIEGLCPADLFTGREERFGIASSIVDSLTRRGHDVAAAAVAQGTGAASPALPVARSAAASGTLPLSVVFRAIHDEASQLRSGNTASALAWTRVHERALAVHDIHGLEFQLHCVKFLQLLSGRVWDGGDGRAPLELAPQFRVPVALAYARAEFPPFVSVPEHTEEVQRLMGLALRSHTQPRLLEVEEPLRRAAAERSFVRARCGLALVSDVGPLDRAVSAGAAAFPHVLRVTRIMAQGGAGSLSLSAELPIEPPCPQFHSVFSDPVLRQQAVPGDNPPMLLSCGHVVSKDTLTRLSAARNRLKCPTCPVLSSVGSAVELHIA